MKRWIAGLLVTIALVALLAAVWEPHHRHWPELLLTAAMLSLTAAMLAAEEGTDDGQK